MARIPRGPDIYNNSSDQIDWLVERKFGCHHQSAEGRQYREELERMSLVATMRFFDLVQSELRAAEAEADALRFYSHPSASADFSKWLEMDAWSIDEAIALSLGKSPHIVTWDAIKAFEYRSIFCGEFGRRRSVAAGAISSGVLAEKNSPQRFLDWVTGLSLDWTNNKPFDLPSKLLELAGMLTPASDVSLDPARFDRDSRLQTLANKVAQEFINANRRKPSKEEVAKKLKLRHTKDLEDIGAAHLDEGTLVRRHRKEW